jgi:biotin-[acetyl-CoA-carboxylase] ligase BirA-like protein
MRLLSDCVEGTSIFAPSLSARKADVHALRSGTEQQLWRVLGGTPELWIAEDALADRDAWRRVFVIKDASRSQFDALRQLLDSQPVLDAPTAAIALGGTGFHGQRGRQWRTAPGNLFLAVALPFDLPAQDLAGALVALPAVAACEAIRELVPAGPRAVIKWVNDILIDGHKVGGVLAASTCRGAVLESAVLGLGINVACTPTVEPTPFVPSAGCLLDAGIKVTLARFTKVLLARLAERYCSLKENGPSSVVKAYREACCIVGRRVRVWNDVADESPVERRPIGAHAIPASSAHSGARLGPGMAARGQGGPDAVLEGIVEAIEGDLSLKLEGHGVLVTRGRLVVEAGGVRSDR